MRRRRIPDDGGRSRWIVVQEGGWSGEWFATAYDSLEQANEAIADHAKATYRSIGPFEVKRRPTTADWLDVISRACAAAATGDFAEVPAKGGNP